MSDTHAPLPAAEQALREAANEYHRLPTRGKISVTPTKPLSAIHRGRFESAPNRP